MQAFLRYSTKPKSGFSQFVHIFVGVFLIVLSRVHSIGFFVLPLLVYMACSIRICEAQDTASVEEAARGSIETNATCYHVVFLTAPERVDAAFALKPRDNFGQFGMACGAFLCL
ncbi:MAG TPA: hypothetical protein PK567_03275 [Bacillota bacterium]|nr:hypothetical protein [Bacillota bacterium]